MEDPSVSLVVIQYGDVNYLNTLLESISNHPDSKEINEVVVVNNGDSIRKEKEDLMKQTSLPIRFHDNQQQSYSSGVNKGVEIADGDLLLISNNDIEWLEGCSIRPLIEQVIANGVGVAGPQQVYPDGSWQRSYHRLPSIKEAIFSVLFLTTIESSIHRGLFSMDLSSRMQPGYVDGAFMCISRRCFEDVGGFDRDFDFYGEDADFCKRVKDNGWSVVFEPASRIMHVRGGTSSVSDAEMYGRKLVEAKSKIVNQNQGPLIASVYRALLTIAFCERAIFYSLLAIFSDNWQSRARIARGRCRGTRNRDKRSD